MSRTRQADHVSRTGRIAFVLANLAGLAGFAWPLFLGASADRSGTHAVDAPVLVALLLPLLVIVAVDEARGRGGDARLVALLGALVAVNAFLRIPKGPHGEGFVFILPILCGWTLGPRFAFLLGAFSMAASGVLTGGVGPWLPFQMFALGWVGAGAGLLRGALRGRFEVPALAGYAVVASLGYGALMNLWFWPFLTPGGGDVHFIAGVGLGETAVRYWRFYLLTSLPWDLGRTLLANAPLVAILARPVGRLLERTKDRFTPQIVVLDETGRAKADQGEEHHTAPTSV